MGSPPFTADMVREIYDYEPDTGLFRWRTSSWRKPSPNKKHYHAAGDIAGCPRGDGYFLIWVNGRSWRAHRVAWLYMTGEWPASGIDHRDGNPGNNAWNNLRQADQTLNSANKRIQTNNKCGFKGVRKHTKGKYQARVTFRRKVHCLGYYHTPEEAHAAYVEGATRVFGEFARAG